MELFVKFAIIAKYENFVFIVRRATRIKSMTGGRGGWAPGHGAWAMGKACSRIHV